MTMSKVIFVTDGDAIAVKAVLAATKVLHLGCIILSGGNPSVCTYEDLHKAILHSKHDTTVVMFDDAGTTSVGPGERLMKRLVEEGHIHVLGALAVSSANRSGDWTRVNVSIDRNGNLVSNGVDKEGIEELDDHRVYGDTVYILDQLALPIIVGVGDLGKMGGKDHPHHGSPVTQRALHLILERSG
ncbi:stage V sporulation protein AE [Geomicrobium sp. JSM 1781026]|uniref:stage V sporulation protein AE n=1 Tax=Geomicrobium sp. JSM 1781026 TaxID=3344580 RepID=UPI0035BF1F31